jgi:hypothetical protein
MDDQRRTNNFQDEPKFISSPAFFDSCNVIFMDISLQNIDIKVVKFAPLSLVYMNIYLYVSEYVGYILCDWLFFPTLHSPLSYALGPRTIGFICC